MCRSSTERDAVHGCVDVFAQSDRRFHEAQRTVTARIMVDTPTQVPRVHQFERFLFAPSQMKHDTAIDHATLHGIGRRGHQQIGVAGRMSHRNRHLLGEVVPLRDEDDVLPLVP